MRPFVMVLLAARLWAATISTSQGDNSRNNANLSETTLTPATVAQLHRLGSYSVDGAVRGQPLFIEGVAINGQVYNVLLVCTMHNSCYAFDAAHPSTPPIWHAGPFAVSRTVYPNDGVLYGQEVGCLATPVADVPNGALFVACTNATPTWVLYKLSLTSGSVLASVTIAGSVLGSGDPAGGDCVSGGVLSFCPGFALIRSGLALANGNVYVAAGSYADIAPFHGWLFAYSAANLAPGGVFCTSPNTQGASFWHSGGAPVVDASGNLYLTTGNGAYDGLKAFGESVLKFSPSLTLLDWFTPANWAALTAADWDLSSGHPMLIPGTTQLTFGAKDFNVYSIDTTCMGHLQGSSACTAPQIFKTNPTGSGQDFGIYGGMFANGVGYFPNVGAQIYSFSISGSTWNTTPRAGSTTAYGFPGAQMTYAGGIVWALTTTGNSETSAQAGTLRALNPADLTEYWNSDQTSGDALGTLAKFASPTISDGMVYAPTLDGKIQVYGLSIPPPTQITPANVPTANKTSVSGTVFLLAAPDVATAGLGTPLCLDGTGLATTIGCSGGTGGSGLGPSASAYNSGSQVVAANTSTSLTFNTNAWDTGGFHSTTLNPTRFTAPSTGYYLATCTVIATAANTTIFGTFNVNGVNPVPIASGSLNAAAGGSVGALTMTGTVHLNAGDYMECSIYSNSGFTSSANKSAMQLIKLGSAL